MADSGIERTVTLPEVPDLKGNADEVSIAIRNHLTILNNSISTMYDDIARRINLFLVLQEWQSVTMAQVTADQNNYALPDGIVIKISTDAPRAFNGFVAPLVERFVVILNDGVFNATFPHQSASADLANRLSTSTGGTVTLLPTQSASFWYDLVISRWRQLML